MGVERRWLRIPEAALYLNIAQGTLRNWLSMGKLRYTKLNGTVLIDKRMLDETLGRNTIETVREQLRKGNC